jgi:hypothetical protein
MVNIWMSRPIDASIVHMGVKLVTPMGNALNVNWECPMMPKPTFAKHA